MWMSHPDFKNIIINSWDQHHLSLLDKITNFTQNLTVWNKNNFKSIYHKKKKHILARLGGVQKAISFKSDEQLLILEKELQNNYNNIFKNEEELWMLKSRVSWLSLGDKNTKKIHRATLIKRRKNKITQLQIEENNWIFYPHEIGLEIRNAFTNTLC